MHVVTSGGGGGCFAEASSYGSSGPHLAWSRHGLGCFCCFFNFRRDFHGLRECQLLFLLTEHGLQDGFIVDGADEAGPHRLVQWILDGWEVACGCHLSDPSCQFRRRLSRLPLDGALELVTFPHSELRRVVVT